MRTTMTVRRLGALVTAATAYADSLLETADTIASQTGDMDKATRSIAAKAEAELREEVALVHEALDVVRQRFPRQTSQLAEVAATEEGEG